MQHLYFLLNELIKSYHVFCKFDKTKANAILQRINEYRLQIAVLAEQRQIFVEQLEVAANASGYKNDIFFTHDDIDSLVVRMIANLADNVEVSLVQQGTRENLFTRQSIGWQQLMSSVQIAGSLGCEVPFDFPQEIYLEKSQTLDIGVVDQTVEGQIFVHGANLKDDYAANRESILKEIEAVEFDGMPCLPKPQLVPIQFQFNNNAVGTPAIAVDGGSDIFSIKSEKSVLLTEVSITNTDTRISLSDRGRNQEICNAIESMGICGLETNGFTAYYPLPYPHLLRRQDRLQLRGVNGSLITGNEIAADTVQTICFRGFTI